MISPPATTMAWPVMPSEARVAQPRHGVGDLVGPGQAALGVELGQLGQRLDSSLRPVLARIFSSAWLTMSVSV